MFIVGYPYIISTDKAYISRCNHMHSRRSLWQIDCAPQHLKAINLSKCSIPPPVGMKVRSAGLSCLRRTSWGPAGSPDVVLLHGRRSDTEYNNIHCNGFLRFLHTIVYTGFYVFVSYLSRLHRRRWQCHHLTWHSELGLSWPSGMGVRFMHYILNGYFTPKWYIKV